MKSVRAFAEAMASADGKLDAFLACEADPVREETEGYFGGYLADAESILERAASRGVVAVPINLAAILIVFAMLLGAFIGGFSAAVMGAV